MTNIEKVRESIGLCPQHDILFETLTVREHLDYFCKVDNIKQGVFYEENQYCTSEMFTVEKYCLTFLFMSSHKDRQGALLREIM